MLDLKPFYINISGYRFTPIEKPEETLAAIKDFCAHLDVKGSVLVAKEGINIAVAGDMLAIQKFINMLDEDERLARMKFHETYSRQLPFDKSVFKIKAELVPIENNQLHPDNFTHQYLPAKELQQWLDEGRDFLLLDMRNDFEYKIGSFETAKQLGLNNFRELKYKTEELDQLPKDKPIVTFCTGGIRCEKAGPYLETQGFDQIYQLHGGVIEYFRATGGKHWQGNCFVFDDRVSLTPDLRAEHIDLCFVCQRKLVEGEEKYCKDCPAQEALSNVAV